MNFLFRRSYTLFLFYVFIMLEFLIRDEKYLIFFFQTRTIKTHDSVQIGSAEVIQKENMMLVTNEQSYKLNFQKL